MSDQEIDRLEIMKRVQRRTLSQAEAARILGLTARHVSRIFKKFEKDGPEALVSKKRGRPSNRRLCLALRKRALAEVAEEMSDFGPTLASEKLADRGMRVHPETLRRWMMDAGLWTTRAKPRTPAQRASCVLWRADPDGGFTTNSSRALRYPVADSLPQRVRDLSKTILHTLKRS